MIKYNQMIVTVPVFVVLWLLVYLNILQMWMNVFLQQLS